MKRTTIMVAMLVVALSGTALAARLSGTAGDDLIRGTSGDDVLPGPSGGRRPLQHHRRQQPLYGQLGHDGFYGARATT
jgi:Ca2+-binding RTX toxin-like protein